MARTFPKLGGQAARISVRVRQGGALVTRLGLLVITVVAGAALAFAVAFTITSVLASADESPVNQQLYNYGTH